MKPDENKPIVVIGAGLSGLACARALADRGIPVVVLEGRQRVAEPWRSRHPALRLNIHRAFAGLPGQRAPRSDGPFLKRDTVVEHLESYASRITVPIEFGTVVTGIERSGTQWRVRSNAGDYECAHVVIATGRDRVPHIPDWQGREGFAGELVHAAELGDVTRFDGKRVLVVGAGNSGSDVLNHLSRQAPAEVWISVRHGPAVVPTRVFGLPLHRLARIFAALPAVVLDPAFRLTQRLFLGDLARFGLKSHPDGGGTRLLRDGVAFAIDDGFVKALREGRFCVVPEVIGIAHDRVFLSGGDQLEPDVVICATGYRSELTPLVGDLGVLDENGQPTHPMGEANPGSPGLWFTGFRPIFTGYFDAARIAAKRICDGIESAGDFDVHGARRAASRRPRVVERFVDTASSKGDAAVSPRIGKTTELG